MSRAEDSHASTPFEHIDYLDLFRAFAILQVVLIHAGNALLLRGLSRVEGDGLAVYALLHILAHDSTIYFAVISGILYGHLFWQRDHRAFMQGRLAKVGLPYLFVTLLLTILLWAAGRIRNQGDADLSDLAIELSRNIVFGEAWNTMWYIPVIIVLYLVSPLLHMIQNRPELRWLFAAIIFLPLIVSRTDTILTPQIFIYFSGSYMFGMWIGQNADGKLDLLSEHIRALIVVMLGSSFLIGLMFAYEIDMLGPVSLRQSIFYIQRLSASVLVLIWFRQWMRCRISPRAHSAFQYLAVAAFGIYFIHAPLLRPIARLVGLWVPGAQPWWALVAAILVTMITGLLLSILLVELVRRAFPKQVKWLIGA